MRRQIKGADLLAERNRLFSEPGEIELPECRFGGTCVSGPPIGGTRLSHPLLGGTCLSGPADKV